MDVGSSLAKEIITSSSADGGLNIINVSTHSTFMRGTDGKEIVTLLKDLN